MPLMMIMNDLKLYMKKLNWRHTCVWCFLSGEKWGDYLTLLTLQVPTRVFTIIDPALATVLDNYSGTRITAET